MSRQNHISSRARAARAADDGVGVAAVAAARAAARTISPGRPAPVSASTTSTLPGRRASASAASRALWQVPDRPSARWIETMSWPAAISGS